MENVANVTTEPKLRPSIAAVQWGPTSCAELQWHQCVTTPKTDTESDTFFDTKNKRAQTAVGPHQLCRTAVTLDILTALIFILAKMLNVANLSDIDI